MNQNTLAPIEQLLLGIWGDIKTCKTTLALTAPKPIFHIDADLGFERAEGKVLQDYPGIIITKLTDEPFEAQRQVQPFEIITKRYAMPIRWPGAPVTGLIDLLGVIASDVGSAYMHPEIASIVIDTGTVMWQVASGAHLERAQLKDPTRINLSQIEYARPNSEMRALYGGARAYGKNLVIAHHVGGKYQDVLGDRGVESQRIGDTWAGFGGMGGIVDVVGRTGVDYSVKGVVKPVLRIDECGYSLTMRDLVLEYPTFKLILEAINGLRSAGL